MLTLCLWTLAKLEEFKLDKKLVVELAERIKLARASYKYQTRKSQNKFQVQPYNTLDFSDKFKLIYKELCVLSSFMRKHPQLSDEDVKEVLKTKFFTFKTLRDLAKTEPNFIKAVRTMGANNYALDLAVKRQELRMVLN